ncbi:discoidin domain-containing protein [Streptomyces sp. NPDC049879]|uniref:galactose-binding domain-containing protein n=1 Tax=Streptomyces sp. NPDC049879 TaxID=3365598 RepID=UPI003798343D
MTPNPPRPPAPTPAAASALAAELGRRRLLALGAGAAAAGLGWQALGPGISPAHAAAAAPADWPAPSYDVHLFYYPWYGSPSRHGSWLHWQQGGHQPPQDIGADLYPTLGPYDSGDAAVVAQHMAWIRQAGVGVVATTWWGQGGYEDQRVPLLLDVAAQYGVKVAWHLEPYGGRTAQSTVDDIRYINARYGSHPAFYRDAKHGNRPAFYVFYSLATTDWSPLAQVNAANIVLTQTTDVSKAGYFGGLYNYSVPTDFNGWKGIADWCRANGRIWAPSIGPGYIDDRAVPGNTTITIPRENGATYDRLWAGALSPDNGGSPHWVSITSFNEWHEGSTIEPASSTPPPGHGYQTYAGAWGTTGAAAEVAYLERTRYWVERFTGGGPTTPPPNPDLALRRPVTASGWTQGFAAVNAVDGDPVSYWESTNHAFPQWLQVDLGSVRDVSRVVVGLPPQTAWGPRTQTIAVQTEELGIWRTAAPAAPRAFDPATGNAVTVTFPQLRTRYVRLTFTGNTAWPAGQASRVEIYAT